MPFVDYKVYTPGADLRNLSLSEHIIIIRSSLGPYLCIEDNAVVDISEVHRLRALQAWQSRPLCSWSFEHLALLLFLLLCNTHSNKTLSASDRYCSK